jgi:hypothetical protein
MAEVIQTYAEIDVAVITMPLALGGGATRLGLSAATRGAEAAEAGGAGFDLALGLGEQANLLAEETGSLTYGQVLGDATFVPENFTVVANEARVIRFTTEGFDFGRWGRWVMKDPENWAPFSHNVTNWELHQVLTNPTWLAKTVWY